MGKIAERFRTKKTRIPADAQSSTFTNSVSTDWYGNQDLKLKGIRNGNCNVTSCQTPGADWYNTSTRAYYCEYCAHEINKWSKHDENMLICFKFDTDYKEENHEILSTRGLLTKVEPD